MATDSQHEFFPVLIVREPSPELLDEIASGRVRAPSALSTGSGVVIMPRKRPRHDDEPGPTVFRLPENMPETCEIQIQASESHMRGFGYVICATDGTPLPALPSNLIAARGDHLMPRFSAPALGRVSWFRDFEAQTCRLRIDQAHAVVRSGQLELTTTVVFSEDNVTPPPVTPQLPSPLSMWQPALQALYERLACTASECPGAHFTG